MPSSEKMFGDAQPTSIWDRGRHAGQVLLDRRESGGVLEALHAVTNAVEHAARERQPFPIRPRRARLQEYQFVGLVVVERPQQHGVDDAEHRAVHADAEREREQDREGRHGCRRERAGCVADVLPDAGHEVTSARKGGAGMQGAGVMESVAAGQAQSQRGAQEIRAGANPETEAGKPAAPGAGALRAQVVTQLFTMPAAEAAGVRAQHQLGQSVTQSDVLWWGKRA